MNVISGFYKLWPQRDLQYIIFLILNLPDQRAILLYLYFWRLFLFASFQLIFMGKSSLFIYVFSSVVDPDP